VVTASAAPWGSSAEAAPPDRLDRFRVLALGRHRRTDEERLDAYREMYRLLDAEILENLASGGVFASREFIQQRLDALAGASGDAEFAVSGVGRVMVGSFEFTDAPEHSAVRAYGRRGTAPALLGSVGGVGRPRVVLLAAAMGGVPQVVVTWEGPSSGRGTQPLRVEILRVAADAVVTMWSTAGPYPHGLLARSWSLHRGELRVRYELHYPGWVPGCPVQTEAEDVWRVDARRGRFVRIGRAQHAAWHRALQTAVKRLVEAVERADVGALKALVPSLEVRRGLPRHLAVESVCDAPDDAVSPRVVSVGARGDEVPWELLWERSGDRWRLIGAGPVLQ